MYYIKLKLYRLEDLSDYSKGEAIRQHREFLVSIYRADDFDKCFNMTRSKYSKSLTKLDIIESIEINEYLFNVEGEIIQTCLYVDGSPRKGQHICTIGGVEYQILKDDT